ncbi:MAG: (deoxy)nucleoside triphosphate pyrophosphohydrolase [Oscillospiraceae bacterium]|nr:(deoxy)nucleoside triphosphate pyrophosphohydrolase [Oscillospiraceae bacterium]
MSSYITDVVAALIRKDDKFLIARRPAHKTRGNLWEFVGGKVERGETNHEALIRECREELGVEVMPSSLYMELIHEYPDMTVRLSLYNAHIVSGEPKLLEHSAIEYISPSQIDDYKFCPADVEILAALRKEK